MGSIAGRVRQRESPSLLKFRVEIQSVERFEEGLFEGEAEVSNALAIAIAALRFGGQFCGRWDWNFVSEAAIRFAFAGAFVRCASRRVP